MSSEGSLGDNPGISEAVLPNGLKCICSQDPSMEKTVIQLDIDSGFFQDPVDLSGLADISLSTVFRGSENYPGVEDLRIFVSKNKIEFRAQVYLARTSIATAVPNHALEEYLDRLTDLVSRPILSRQGLDYAEVKHGQAYYANINNDVYRESQLLQYLQYGISHQTTLLFKRKDLLTCIREFVSCFYCPSKMTVYIMGNAPIVDLKALIYNHFGKMSQRNHLKMPPYLRAPGCDRDFTNTLRVRGQAVFARMFIRSDKKKLTLSFRLPSNADVSSVLYVASLFHTSQAHSLRDKLESDTLIDHLDVRYRNPTFGCQTLDLHFSVTDKGSRNISIVVGFVLGYVEIIKRMQPNSIIFNQAHDYFKSVRVMNNSFELLEMFACELAMGSKLDDLRLAEVPRVFDAASINDVAHSLTLDNCVIVAMSDEYTDTKVHVETDFFLQYSIENLFAEALFDGLSQPQPYPLVEN